MMLPQNHRPLCPAKCGTAKERRQKNNRNGNTSPSHPFAPIPLRVNSPVSLRQNLARKIPASDLPLPSTGRGNEGEGCFNPRLRILECGDLSPLLRRRLVAVKLPRTSEPARTPPLARAVKSETAMEWRHRNGKKEFAGSFSFALIPLPILPYSLPCLFSVPIASLWSNSPLHQSPIRTQLTPPLPHYPAPNSLCQKTC